MENGTHAVRKSNRRECKILKVYKFVFSICSFSIADCACASTRCVFCFCSNIAEVGLIDSPSALRSDVERSIIDHESKKNMNYVFSLAKLMNKHRKY